jgi:hypothetical protein
LCVCVCVFMCVFERRNRGGAKYQSPRHSPIILSYCTWCPLCVRMCSKWSASQYLMERSLEALKKQWVPGTNRRDMTLSPWARSDLRVGTHPYMLTHVHPYIHTSIRTYVHTYIHAYIHTYIHTYVHARVPTYVRPHLWQSPKSRPQILTVLSAEAVAMISLSEDTSMAITGSLCP